MSNNDDSSQQPMFVAEKPQQYGEVDPARHPAIRGYPDLRWAGKRTPRQVNTYPRQHKESYSGNSDVQRNALYWGDNLQVMGHLLATMRGGVDLIYIDPPYDSKADYKRTIKLRGHTATSSRTTFEEKQYTDIWTNDEYLQFMYERLVLMRELLRDSGSIYLHCDWRRAHHLRCLMDEVFGPTCFQNEIIWNYSGWNRRNRTYFNRRHDSILYYSKTESPSFDPWQRPWESKEAYVTARKQRVLTEEGTGREYVLSDAGGGKRVRRYLEEAMAAGSPIDDVWTIDKLNNSDKERVDYPTQKPERLLERIVLSSCPPGGVVFDCFMGSGTTQVVALKHQRHFIGADINLGAVEATRRRVLLEMKQLGEKAPGLDVYTVNNYEVFRNPVQAKELLLEAIGAEPLAGGGVFDGQRDGRKVKIMPVNRIATREDLNDLLATLDYGSFERRQSKRPGEPVEHILIVCMGHEPDLKAHLIREVPYKLDVEVVDILRDRADLQFKRDSEADVAVVDGELVIRAFYPMSLLQKLSVMKEDVGEWRELVDSVLVDFNYDGAVMQPSVVDVPGRGEMVKGRYPVPADAGTIRVRITDLLSESWEGEVEHG